ncbi:hypothetical protein AQJ43_11090 [Streptomyces avermitilis]|nr:hypothetical protein AQJ43_11090 [Streptomyces avermitilis]OOV21849.1 hypothetical protein SM007_32200 [Streptomyces avermitilis]
MGQVGMRFWYWLEFALSAARRDTYDAIAPGLHRSFTGRECMSACFGMRMKHGAGQYGTARLGI